MYSKFRIPLFGALIISSTVACLSAAEEAPTSWGNWPLWGDQGNGSYRNPVLPSDYSDLDCIRVGDDYYAISSTFQYSPGMIILRSRDLVNWRIIGHVVSDVTQIGPDMNWDRMNRYGRGIWAGAIRYNKGKFWVYFGTPEEGYFMSSATNAAGPWEPLHRMTTEGGWDDCCPFWDDDGQGYFVGTHFKGGYKTWLYKLTDDGRDIIPDSGVMINEGSKREANKLYKINGTYYHFYSEVGPEGRGIMMQRSKNIAGPYTEKRKLSHVQAEIHEPNQGGLVQSKSGDWWFLTHHGHGDWEGRPASLLPVTWTDGWPVIGKVGPDGIGKMVWTERKPLQNGPTLVPQSDDDFSGPQLGVQWEWNYQPRAEKWSLSARSGWLRLNAWKPLRPDNLKLAGNTLTQRVMRSARNVVTVELDPAGMADGQVAGLCHYNRNYGTIAIRREQGALFIETARNQAILRGPAINKNATLKLRSEWGLDGLCRFSYSMDGKTFTSLGEPYQFGWADYRGERIGLFSYNNAGDAGYADFRSFTYRYDSALTR